MSTPQFSFEQEILKEVAKWAVPFIGAFVAVFFTPIVERVRTRINRADLRTKQFEEFASDISHFLFHAELVHKYFIRGWTKPKDLDPIITDYNEAITAIRKKEYVYLSWANRYWKEAEATKFSRVIDLVKSTDEAIHALYVEKPDSSLTDALAIKVRDLEAAAKVILLPATARSA